MNKFNSYGRKHGYWEEVFFNKIMKGNYDHGLMHGVFRVFDMKGYLKSKHKYELGFQRYSLLFKRNYITYLNEKNIETHIEENNI